LKLNLCGWSLSLNRKRMATVSEARTIDEAWARLPEQDKQAYELGWRFVLDMKAHGRECLERNEGVCVVEREISD